jgi:4-aminobutyrate aminotransferase-like enzyme
MTETRNILSLNAFRDAAGVGAPLKRALSRRLSVLGEASPLFYDEPLHLSHAEGVWLYDHDGRAYLDAYNNVPSVGHCHPHVVSAISRQAGTLATNTRYLYDILTDYAEALLASFPAGLSQIVFTCTGSESVDLSLRVARRSTGGQGIVVTDTAYHGNTTAVAAISPSSGASVPIGVDVRTVAPPDRREGPDVGARFAARIEAAIADLRRHGIGFAAFIADSVFSSDGVFVDPPGMLAETQAVVRAAGGCYIADEVQPGFGRTGDAMWGFARHGLAPDMVVLGKPMGNGMPVAGLVARPEVIRDFARESGYFNTFGGNPVAAAAGLAVLQVIEREGLMENARVVGAYLRDGFAGLADRIPVITDVRGAGLYLGIELARDGHPASDIAASVVGGMRRHGVLIGLAGAHANVLKIRPPLCFSRENADQLLRAAEDVLKTL